MPKYKRANNRGASPCAGEKGGPDASVPRLSSGTCGRCVVSKPRKRPASFDPIGDLLHALEHSPHPWTEAEEERRFHAAVAKIHRKGGEALVQQHLDRHFPPPSLSLEERVLRWGGKAMAEHFKVLGNLDVSAEGQEKIWGYLNSLRHTRSYYMARITPEVRAYLGDLRKWFDDGYALLVRDEHTPPPGCRQMVQELVMSLLRAERQIARLPAVWSRPKRGPIPTGFDSGTARTKLVKLMTAHVTEWQEAKEIHRKALEKLAASMLQTMDIQNYRRTEAEIQALIPHPRDRRRSEA